MHPRILAKTSVTASIKAIANLRCANLCTSAGNVERRDIAQSNVGQSLDNIHNQTGSKLGAPLHHVARVEGLSNCLCCPYKSPIILSAIEPWLDRYPARAAAHTIRSGFAVGFKLGYSGKRVHRMSKNLVSATKDMDRVMQKLDKEIKLGRIAGPFDSLPIPNLIVSPVGLVPKAQKGKFRMIHHLSHPDGDSINDGIDRDICQVKYANFDDAISIVVRAGKGALLAKADIESAFRLLPIHPSDFHLLGICANNMFYVDKALPMGASCSPAYFETFSTFLEWVIRQDSGSDLIVHYMDDFLFVAGNGEERSQSLSCQMLVERFESICKKFGVPLAADKAAGPATVLVFLGLEIDTVNQTVSIPEDKLKSVIEKVRGASEASALTLRALQSVIGSLAFVCRAISPGRAFLRRLIDLTIGVRRPSQKIALSVGARSDLKMWLVFLRNFNGRAIFPDQFWWEDSDIQLFTDASGEIGFGGYFRGRWFQGRWPREVLNHSIAWLEFFPILVALVVWGDSLRGKRIVIRSDNTAVVAIINKQTSKCPLIMHLVRFFVLQCLKVNVTFFAKHIPGKNNGIADALSRFQMARFVALAPGAEAAGTEVPDFLWRL